MTDDTSRKPGRAAQGNAGEADDSGPRDGGPSRASRQGRSAPRQERPAGGLSAAAAARCAARAVCELTGHDAETVISVERGGDNGWKVGVEVVETHRIPDSADILASYEVVLDREGELVSYRRTHRYARGQLYGGSR